MTLTPTRRAVLRLGAHTAWAVPVVVAVSATPALAVSGPASISTTVVADRTGDLLDLAVTFTNANSQPTANFLAVVTLTPTNLLADFSQSTALVDDPAYDPPVVSSLVPRGVTFTYDAMAQVPGNGTKTLTVTIRLAPTIGIGTATVRGNPGGGTGATDTPGIATF